MTAAIRSLRADPFPNAVVPQRTAWRSATSSHVRCSPQAYMRLWGHARCTPLAALAKASSTLPAAVGRGLCLCPTAGEAPSAAAAGGGLMWPSSSGGKQVTATSACPCPPVSRKPFNIRADAWPCAVQSTSTSRQPLAVAGSLVRVVADMKRKKQHLGPSS